LYCARDKGHTGKLNPPAKSPGGFFFSGLSDRLSTARS
jgi:hypothetical protein